MDYEAASCLADSVQFNCFSLGWLDSHRGLFHRPLFPRKTERRRRGQRNPGGSRKVSYEKHQAIAKEKCRVGPGRSMKTVLCILLLLSSVQGTQNPPRSLADFKAAERLFKATGLDRRYAFSSHLKPSYLTGDFDGDGKSDIAILVKQKSSGKIGIAVCHSSTNMVFFIGAGTSVGNGGDNFDWMDIWNVTPKARAVRKVGRAAAAKLKGDALLVEKSESASALIYWNGKRYLWRQQGD